MPRIKQELTITCPRGRRTRRIVSGPTTIRCSCGCGYQVRVR